MSFVRGCTDVQGLLDDVGGLGRDNLGIVLKIETRQAFEHLPQLLLTAMRWPHVGVMIARGDLAVECGAERMAELQEEILWLCEAAHLPVIWATQVLEQLAKDGLPSRAEISDAAMGERAECVMLNKAPISTRPSSRSIIAVIAFLEGRTARRGETCCLTTTTIRRTCDCCDE
jgi:pyruvate kinase